MLLNEDIQGDSFRLVFEDGTSKIVTREEMFSISENKSLDLMLVNEKLSPPVVKLLDHNNFLKERAKALYQSSKKSKNKNSSKTKSIIFKLTIEDQDLEWKVKKAKEWLASGERVQLVIKVPFDVYEESSKKPAADLLSDKFSELVADEGKAIDKLRPLNRSRYFCFFVPKTKK